jgi:hypothetical protein
VRRDKNPFPQKGIPAPVRCGAKNFPIHGLDTLHGNFALLNRAATIGRHADVTRRDDAGFFLIQLAALSANASALEDSTRLIAAPSKPPPVIGAP